MSSKVVGVTKKSRSDFCVRHGNFAVEFTSVSGERPTLLSLSRSDLSQCTLEGMTVEAKHLDFLIELLTNVRTVIDMETANGKGVQK